MKENFDDTFESFYERKIYAGGFALLKVSSNFYCCCQGRGGVGMIGGGIKGRLPSVL